MFIGREEELAALGRRYESGRAELVVLYGRRRVGKSELIEQFLRGRRGVRLLAREEAERPQLARFSGILASFFADEVLSRSPLSGWEAFFAYLAGKAGDRLVVALDEFPYLAAESPALASTLQGLWDDRLRHTRLFLILCGSSISMMETAVLGHKSPLYGRRTGQVLLAPLPFRSVAGYLRQGVEGGVRSYGVFGGTPAYVMEQDPAADALDNVRERVLAKDSVLYRDVEFMLREEVREPRYYLTVLASVAKGNTRLSEIMNDTGLERGLVAKYLSVLSDLHLVRRDVPVTEDPLRSRKGVYMLSDPFVRFWFRYVHPHKEMVERGDRDHLVEHVIRPSLDQFLGPVFEEVCLETLAGLGRPFHFERLGRWWDRGEELDIVALNEPEGQLLLGECKWQRGVDAARVVGRLEEKAELVPGRWRERFYAVFAKGFGRRVEAENVLLFDLEDIARANGLEGLGPGRAPDGRRPPSPAHAPAVLPE